MSYKIKISKAGYNVLTETDPDNLVYSSDYDSLKYYSGGTAELEVSGSDAETYITHGLGYIPFFICYVNYVSTETEFSFVPFSFADAGYYAHNTSYADDDKIYFKCETNTVSVTFTFAYKIFRNNTGL